MKELLIMDEPKKTGKVKKKKTKAQSMATSLWKQGRTIEILKKEKNDAYLERNLVVCALSKLFPAWLGKHDLEQDPNWYKEWVNIVYIQLPTGQVSWHFHEDLLPMFENHLEYDPYEKWDGHTTAEKYERLSNL